MFGKDFKGLVFIWSLNKRLFAKQVMKEFIEKLKKKFIFEGNLFI